jgi:hypothetical protein
MRILARLIVPFNFSFEANTKITFTVDNEKIIFIGQPCEGVRVLSYLTKDFEKLNGPKKGREFLRATQKFKKADSVPMRTIILHKESENYLEGTIDLLKSTLFDIYFSYPDTDLEKDKSAKDLIKDKAFQILSFFINSYRAVTNEPDIHNPSHLDLPAIELAYSKENWTDEDEIIEGSYYFLMRTMTWLPANATGYFKDPMKIDAFKKFNDYLNSNEPVPYHLQLLADAREQAIIHKNYNLSIVLSSTATDFYLKDRLLRECNSRKISILTIGKGKHKTDKNYLEAILEGSLRDDIIGDICGFLTNENIKVSSQYHNWFRHAYDIRNQIIHEGLIINDAEIAKEAFEVVIILINYINDLLIKARKK